MSPIELEIEGTGAISAAEALLQIEGLSATFEPVGEDTKEGTLAAIATIVGITVGTMDIASRLHKWYSNHKQTASSQRIEQVVLVDRQGQRVLMANATIEQIKAVLES
jgi:hypothetical protein